MKNIFLYTYYINEREFVEDLSFTLEDRMFDLKKQNNYMVTSAISATEKSKRRVLIASKPGKVYFDTNSNCYRVWFYESNQDKAINSSRQYVFDTITPNICIHSGLMDYAKTNNKEE